MEKPLRKRSQLIFCDNVLSQTYTFRCGIRQGSASGSPVVVTYINIILHCHNILIKVCASHVESRSWDIRGIQNTSRCPDEWSRLSGFETFVAHTLDTQIFLCSATWQHFEDPPRSLLSSNTDTKWRNFSFDVVNASRTTYLQCCHILKRFKTMKYLSYAKCYVQHSTFVKAAMEGKPTEKI